MTVATSGRHNRSSPDGWRGIEPALVFLALSFWCATAHGQPVATEISTDGTLGPPVRVQGASRLSGLGHLPAGGHLYEISDGLGRRPSGGQNLFHSFERFSVAGGDIAVFTATLPTKNVISRVTGSVRSDIYGTVRSTIPDADIYLLNPSGIVFGPQAALDVRGSFHVSTSPALYFADQKRFSASGDRASVLSISDPIDFGFFSPNASPFSLADISFRGTDLRVPLGQTIGIEGGELRFSGSRIVSPGGRIEIRSNSLVAENGTLISTDSFSQAGAIEVNVSGSMDVWNSTFSSSTPIFASGHAGSLIVSAGSLSLRDGRLEAESKGIGRGGKVSILVHTLAMSDDSRVNTSNRDFDNRRHIGTGNPAGHIEVLATGGILLTNDGIEVNGFINEASNSASGGSVYISAPILVVEGRSGIQAKTSGNDPRMSITLEVGRLVLLNGGQIDARNHNGRASGTGPGPLIEIRATDSVLISGEGIFEDLRLASGILAAATWDEGDPPSDPFEPMSGSPGSIHIDTPVLILADLAQITVEKEDRQTWIPGGEIQLNVGDLLMEGGAGITATGRGKGSAGSIVIEADGDIALYNGARIESVARDGVVDAGQILVDAQNLTMRGGSGIATRSDGAGAAGTITVRVDDRLTLADATIDTSTNSARDPTEIGVGTIDLTARELTMRGGTIAARTTGTVDAGTIALNVDTLALRDEAAISTSAKKGGGSAGEITVTATGDAVLEGESRIESRAQEAGDAGDIELTAHNLTLIDSALSTESRTAGAAGTITVQVDDRLTLADATIDTSTSSVRDPTEIGVGTIDLTARELTMSGGTIAARTTGSVDAGTIALNVDTLALRGEAGISTSAEEGGGSAGKITVTATGEAVLEGESRIESLAHGAGDAGDIELTADNLTLIDSALSTESRTAGAAGTITVRVDDRLTLADATIDTSTSSVRDPTEIGVGTIDLTARELTMSGGTIAARTTGAVDAGNVIVGAERVAMESGAALTSSSTAAGNGGTIVIRGMDGESGAREVILSDSSISTSAADAVAGDIMIAVGDHLGLSDASTITAGVADGRGGEVRIASPQTVILSDESRILAQASGGQGGDIVIDAEVVLASEDSLIDASATASGVDGTVQINSPEVDIESALTPLATPFIDPSTLLGQRCAARGAEVRGSFVLAPGRESPPSPESWLQAFDVVEAAAYEDLRSTADGHAALEDAAREAFARGSKAFSHGEFDRAAEAWFQAATYSEDLGHAEMQSDALRAAAQAQQAGGNFVASLQPLRRSLTISERAMDSQGVASALGALGVAQATLGKDEEAIESFSRGFGLAKKSGEAGVAAAILINLGNYHAVLGAFDEAHAAYLESAALGRRTRRRIREARALSNAARTAIWLEDADLSVDLLRKSQLLAQSTAQTYAAAAILVHVAKSHEQIAAASPSRRESSLLSANEALTSAITVAQQVGDQRVLSYALGNLGALYEREHRLGEALYLTRRALRAAPSDASELSYRWHWQEGRLLWARGQANAAVHSFRRSIAAIEEEDQDSLARNDSRYFERMVAPVYFDLVDSLLRGSEMVEGRDQADALLIEAREVMERFKAAELRDYFRDECIAALWAKTRSLDAVGETTAVVYPILLPERTELLVTLPSGLRRYTVDVGSSALTAEVQRFRVALRGLTRAYLHPGRRLYDWLVRPYEDALATEAVDTLVFVPGGPLLTIPMAALHDGDRFLIERYATAVAPGLTMVDPQPLDRGNVRAFLAGVSTSVQGYPALANVPDELRTVQDMFGGQMLLDQQFELERAEQQLVDAEPSLVHIASHGEFTGDPATSFVLAYDGKLTMDRLGNAVSAGRFRDEPLELLMLSGCETAAGDHRAALGLAGLAVRSGARSAVGSLWPIGDEATLLLVKEFYRVLAYPSASRAEALRRAQLELIEHRVFWHPRYWSPFLLISNWL